MATAKSMKIQAEIDKVKAKISEQQARLKEAGLWDKVSRSPRMRKRRKTEYETVSSFDSGALCRCFVMRL